VVHVDDASKAVGVVSRLLSAERGRSSSPRWPRRMRPSPEAWRRARPRPIPLAEARANAFDRRLGAPPEPPARTGLIDVPDPRWRRPERLHRLVAVLLDVGDEGQTFPRILDDPEKGPAARELYANAQAMLARIVAERWFTPRAALAIWPANRDGDDIVVWTDEARTTERARFHMLRQQTSKRGDRANYCLADFVLPEGPDWIGGFAVNAGPEVHVLAERYKAEGNDYDAIMVQALADRLAEAMAEAMHAKLRREFWGYETGRAPDVPRADRGGISRHPPRPRLPRLPGPHREAHALRAAGGGGAHGPDADRKLRHVAGRRRLWPLFRASRGRLFRGRAHRRATRSPITLRARAFPWPRPNAGCRRTSPTSRASCSAMPAARRPS
jgi:5-methyltetrahydrofolate--homocysteine methyltransferase